jgi:isoleucyl-tRNA synthetase
MLDFKQIEEEILNFWEKQKIYEKSKKKNKKGKKFYFLQGPPYTSGKIHIGHAWNNSLKDMIMRYKRLKGFNVWDRAGYDTHGLPTENAVQKKLGFKTKEEILKKGMDIFIKECMKFSKEHAGYMNEDLKRFGIWMDFDNAYMPNTKDYISGQWKFFKKADEQGRLYKGSKVMHWDAETETALAKHELEYETVEEDSIFLKFKTKKYDNTYFLVWTTTPWTIPFNLGIMVNPEVDYLKIELEEKGKKEYWIIAEALAGIFMNSVVGKKFRVIDKFKGEDLEGEEYEHFLEKESKGKYSELKKKYPKIHTVLLSKQYVNTMGGTGLVHCAPGCGPEDEEVAREYGIEPYNNLNERGEFTESEFRGWKAKIEDKKFIEHFKKKGNLIATTKVEHEYPHSWRSHKPVIFRTTEQWFLKTGDLADKLMKFNKKVYWVPKKSGESYERWAENLKDNSAVRQRFWGCPVPVWVNEKNEKDYLVIGSVEELEKLTNKKFDDLTIHKPWIDKVIIEKNGKVYRRIEDVSDVWIDSGTASWNCLYNDEKLIKEWFPADLILEATEQTRLWFSLLQICSSIVFNKSCYDNVYVHGMLLDFQGTKMSKSLGNIISPYEVVDRYSSDIFRYYICEITAGENINFNWEDVKQKQRNLLVLMNISNYIRDLINSNKENSKNKIKLDIEEKYILSRANSTLKKVTDYLDNYHLDKSINEIEKLFLDLSRVYIKVTRDKANDDKTTGAVLQVISEIYLKSLKMFSIVCPLITEYLWQELRKIMDLDESVHLSDWPRFDNKLIDERLEKEFEIALEIIEKGLAQRDKEQIGLKWPLSKAIVTTDKKINKELQKIIIGQLNIKRLEVKPGKETSVKLDTKLTKELEAEGYAREISRKVQAGRKKEGLIKSDRILLFLDLDKGLIQGQLDLIKERTGSQEIKIGKIEETDYVSEDKIKDKLIRIGFRKV